MRKIIFLLILSFYYSNAQNTNIDLYFALDTAKNEDAKTAIKLEMYKLGFTTQAYSLSKDYYAKGENKLGYDFLIQAIKEGSNIELIDLTFIPNSDYQLISKDFEKLKAFYYSNRNNEMCEFIKYLYNTDQYFAKEDFYGGRRAQHPIRQKIFQNNLTKLREYIIEKNNSILPQKEQIGGITRDVVVMLMHHTRLDSIDEVNHEFFEPILKQEVLYRKSYSPFTYVQFVDNMQLVMEENRLQVYGHFRNFKTNKICDLKYPEKVDLLRAEIGLQPLKEYALKNGFLLPDNYVEQ